MSKKSKKHEQQNGHAEATPATPPETIPGAKKIGQPYTQDLPVKNKDAQQLVLAGQLSDVILEKARVEGEKTAIEEKKKQELAEKRERIEELEAEERELARQVHTGTHQEQVECVEYLLPTNQVQVVRTDTGEVVETRTADAEDLQGDLDFDEDDVPGTEHHDTPGEEEQELSEDRP